ncbi:MAG TPA: hypothetical protein VJR25_08345, partial [Microbacterium sp.]|uniref:hypothetical protein n=1 Tax=Microbacterium sp. TaxID=51671 RepID=UPI002B4741C3
APPEGPPGATDRHPEPSPVGGHVAAGVGLGLLGLVAGLIVAFSGVNLGTVGFPAWITTLTGFSLVTAVGVVLTVLRRTRRTGAGYLIVVAASWIVIIGPCVTLQYAFHA